MPYNYKVEPTANPLTADKLYEGLMVCFSDVTTNPNRVGILEKTTTTINSVRYPWAATIDSVRYEFDRDGCLPGTTTPVLYGVVSDGSLDPTTDTYESRAGGQGESDKVSLKTMYPKDYFACHALNALIQTLDNPLAINDGTIALLAAKSYKIAQAMAKEAYESRENDAASEEQSGESYVEVDETTLQTNTERILYNINESLKASNDLIDAGVKVKGNSSYPFYLRGSDLNNPVYTQEVQPE